MATYAEINVKGTVNTAGDTTLYTVPAGTSTLLTKGKFIFKTTSTALTAFIVFKEGTGPNVVWEFTLARGDTVIEERVVFAAAETLVINIPANVILDYFLTITNKTP